MHNYDVTSQGVTSLQNYSVTSHQRMQQAMHNYDVRQHV